MTTYKYPTRAVAIRYLEDRYEDQLQRYPRLARIPKSLYVRRNLRAAMRVTAEEEP